MAGEPRVRGWKGLPVVVRVLVAACALAVVAQGVLLVGTTAYEHVHYDFEAWPGFQAAFGFVAFCLLVLGARLLGTLTARAEDHYDDRRPLDPGLSAAKEEDPEDEDGHA
jgi:hypothetical protein